MTKKLERKLRRQNISKAKKEVEKEIKEKLGLFNRLPEKCLTCEEPFDKKNKDQVFTWNVVVNKKEDIVRLYCPSCWEKAQEIIKGFAAQMEERKNKKV
jgi:Zn finger protein HypA/HybF involved in hydrogenase expression